MTFISEDLRGPWGSTKSEWLCLCVSVSVCVCSWTSILLKWLLLMPIQSLIAGVIVLTQQVHLCFWRLQLTTPTQCSGRVDCTACPLSDLRTPQLKGTMCKNVKVCCRIHLQRTGEVQCPYEPWHLQCFKSFVCLWLYKTWLSNMLTSMKGTSFVGIKVSF